MYSPSCRTISQINRFRINRRSRKLQILDEYKLLLALPKDVPERIWLELFQKEETDQLIYNIFEEIYEDAMDIVYEKYMARQTIYFTVDCAVSAWRKIIDWHFYRHDPGEERSATPACYIPKREESWVPDEMPQFSVKDTMAKQELEIQELIYEEPLRSWPSSDSIDMPLVDPIPIEYWFPGKVMWPQSVVAESNSDDITPVMMGANSEVLQKVTNYSSEETSVTRHAEEMESESSETSDTVSSSPTPTMRTIEASSHDLRRSKSKSKAMPISSFSSSKSIRYRKSLPPIYKDSPMSAISDCRLRYLRFGLHHYSRCPKEQKHGC